MSKYCPIHGTEDSRHLVNYCTCPSEQKFPINLIGELVAIAPESTSGTEHIRLPDWKRQLKGTVVARGPDCNFISEGQVVGFGAAVGMDSVFAGQDLRIMKEQDIDFVYEA